MKRGSAWVAAAWMAWLGAMSGVLGGCDDGSSGSEMEGGVADARMDAGGGDGGPIDGGADGGPDGGAETRDCDPLAPSYCAMPFPNDYWTETNPETPTGKQLALPQNILPKNRFNVRPDPAAFNEADGFSPGVPAMTHMPQATTEGLPGPDNIEASLADDSPTVIINAETGERVPHWAELDQYVVESRKREMQGHEEPGFTIGRDLEELRRERALIVRPAVRLDTGTRYIAAIRDVVDENGDRIPASSAFQALRDGTDAERASVEARRSHFEDIFGTLSDAGIARDDLQIAWDWTTASRQNNTQWMLHIRDEAFENHPDGVPYTVSARDHDELNTETMACFLEFSLEVPLYLDTGEAGGTFVFGSDGMPEQNGTFEYKAWMIVPKTAQSEPAPLVAFGHGLLGSGLQVLGSQEFADEGNLAFFGLDWIGMASDDISVIVEALAQGNLSKFRSVPERLNQGFLNFLLAMRTLSREAEGASDNPLNSVLASECGGAELDGTSRYYFGGSQGGIFGASLMSLFQDVQRGLLAVPGQPYNLLLNRSVDFDEFTRIVYPNYGWNALDMQINLALIQALWDRASPTGYSEHIRTNTFRDTPSHEVLLQVSLSDFQVSNLGAHIMARTIGGVRNLAPTVREVWGIDEVTGAHTGSAMLEIDFGNPTPPMINIPPWQQQEDGLPDPHGRAGEVDALSTMLQNFYETGTVENRCNGPCDGDDL